MSRRKWARGRPPHHRHRPLVRAEKVPPSPERIANTRAAAEAAGFDPDQAEQLVLEEAELWQNDRYVVSVTREPKGDPAGWVRILSIRRSDRGPDFPWRDLQRIKTQLAGEDAEGIELFPAEDRLVDTANQRWLWCGPPGFRFPIGFEDGRLVASPKEAAAWGARQSRLDR